MTDRSYRQKNSGFVFVIAFIVFTAKRTQRITVPPLSHDALFFVFRHALVSDSCKNAALIIVSTSTVTAGAQRRIHACLSTGSHPLKRYLWCRVLQYVRHASLFATLLFIFDLYLGPYRTRIYFCYK